MLVAPVWVEDEVMLMILPQEAASMSGRTSRVHKKGPFKFTAIMRSQASTGISMKGTNPVMPALLTMMAIGANAARVLSAAALIALASVASTWTAMALPPASEIILAVSVAPASLMSQSAIAAWWAARRF